MYEARQLGKLGTQSIRACHKILRVGAMAYLLQGPSTTENKSPRIERMLSENAQNLSDAKKNPEPRRPGICFWLRLRFKLRRWGSGRTQVACHGYLICRGRVQLRES